MALDVPPGVQDIQLSFVTPLETYIGRMITGISIAAAIAMMARRNREERAA